MTTEPPEPYRAPAAHPVILSLISQPPCTLRCMARGIEYRSTYPFPAAQVFGALIDPDYLRERLRVLSGDNELVEHVRTGDGARYEIRQGVRPDAIPAIARTVVGSELTINRSEVWRQEAGGRFTGEVTAGITAMPHAISGSLHLRPAPGGQERCEFLVEGSVGVSIPFVGGKLEDLFTQEVHRLLSDETRFTTEWLSRHG